MDWFFAFLDYVVNKWLPDFCVVESNEAYGTNWENMKGLISWEELVTCLFVAGVLYYGIILFRFYKQQLRQAAGRTAKVKWSRESFQRPEQSVPVDEKESATDHTLASAVHELMQEIKEVFAAAVRDNLLVEQLLGALQARLKQYPQIKTSAFKDAINQHILNEFQLQLSVPVNIQMIDQLW